MLERIKVVKDQEGQTLISFLKRRFKKSSISLIYKLIRVKKITVNLEKSLPGAKVKEKDTIEINDSISDKQLIDTKNSYLTENKEKEKKLEIIFEDDNIIGVWKKNNVSIDKLNNEIKRFFYKKRKKNFEYLCKNNFSLNSLHQLDKLVSGIVLYAKNFHSQRAFYQALKGENNTCIIRKYLAICHKKVNIEKYYGKKINGYIKKNDKKKKMEFNWKKEENDNSKECSIRISSEKENKNFIILDIKSYSGRKHQIRCILSHIGVPIIGDLKYGGCFKKEKINLFAYGLFIKKILYPLEYLNNKTIEVNKENIIKNIVL